MKVLVLDYISSIGGVQSVEKNILENLSNEIEFYFLDPYNSKFVDTIKNINNVNTIKFNIYPSKNKLGWDKLWKKPIILLLMGPSYLIYNISLGFKLKKIGIELLYVHTKKSVISAFIISKIFRIKYVYHAHGFGSYKHIHGIYKKAIIKSQKIVAVSKDVENKLLLAGIDRDKIKVVHNGIDIDKINKVSKYKVSKELKESNLKIISVSSIHEGKGIHVLIQAVNELLLDGYDVSLNIIGDIPSKNEIEYKQILLELSKKVDSSKFKFIGWTSNPYKYIGKSDMLVLPSIKEESFGMVLVEAMSLKKIVMGSNIGGIPEVIEDNKNGFLFEPDNVKELKKKIEYVINNKEKLKDLIENGYDSAKYKFSTEKQGLSISKLLKGI